MHLAGDANDVGRMTTAGALGVIHVNGATADRFQRILDEAGFVQRVGMDLHLEIVLIGDTQTGIDRRRHRAPVLVKLEAHHAGLELLDQWRAALRITPAPETKNYSPCLCGLPPFFPVVEGAALHSVRDPSART